MNPSPPGPRSFLLDDARRLPGAALLFERPHEWIEARTPDEAAEALGRLDAARHEGRWVAAAFAYELGYLLEPKLSALMPETLPDPLIIAGVFDAPARLDKGAAEALFASLARTGQATTGLLDPSWSEARYGHAFDAVQAFIAAGDLYQLNLTFPASLPVAGPPLALAERLRLKARAGYSALVRADGRDVLSFSPELFVTADASGRIRARPMKGTAARGPHRAEDLAAAASLASDPKQRAENLMIVDLLRNDLSRVAQTGSVTVSDLYTVETYPTLHTMTSGIEARMKPELGIRGILAALFPCGSVTGAPKIRAMEIIRALEPAPRGLYCGAIGAFGPDGSFRLSVAIRTLIHEHGSARLRLNTGSGLVADSAARAEYAECLLKARFAADAGPAFDLLETMRWDRDKGILFLEEHLERLAQTARYFAYAFDRSHVDEALRRAIEDASGDRLRLRLTLRPDGIADVAAARLEADFVDMFGDPPSGVTGSPWRLAVSAHRVSGADPFIRHKTTRRGLYEAEFARATAGGAADEILFLNEEGRVAEASRTTVFALKGGKLLTPALAEGALDGVLRRVLIARGAPPVEETRLSLGDLRDADQIFCGNSVRGLMPAVLL
jgi:para-aminobenzoate synthetase / 4-amino-4-deoxychorismate lyase